MTTTTNLAETNFLKFWENKSISQIRKEILSWQKHFDKHSKAYTWHKSDMHIPGTLSDGDKITFLKEILEKREKGLVK